MDQITTTSISRKLLKKRKQLRSSQLSVKDRAKIAGNEDFCKFSLKISDHTLLGSEDATTKL